MSLPTPYYDKDGIVIYNCDCRDILPYLPKVDLVLTDPPYGIGADTHQGPQVHGWKQYPRGGWDKSPPAPETISAIVAKGEKSIVWGGNFFESLPTSAGWLIWNKVQRNFSMGEAELAWTNFLNSMRVFDLSRAECISDGKSHPTQKSLKLLTWCISFVPDAETILDPFMGSGTTLVAAKQLGKKCIGIEIDEKYCAIAVERLAQGNLFGEVSV